MHKKAAAVVVFLTSCWSITVKKTLDYQIVICFGDSIVYLAQVMLVIQATYDQHFIYGSCSIF